MSSFHSKLVPFYFLLTQICLLMRTKSGGRSYKAKIRVYTYRNASGFIPVVNVGVVSRTGRTESKKRNKSGSY